MAVEEDGELAFDVFLFQDSRASFPKHASSIVTGWTLPHMPAPLRKRRRFASCDCCKWRYAVSLVMEYPELKAAGEVNELCVHLEKSVKKWWKDEGIIPQQLLRSWALSIRSQWNADNLTLTTR